MASFGRSFGPQCLIIARQWTPCRCASSAPKPAQWLHCLSRSRPRSRSELQTRTRLLQIAARYASSTTTKSPAVPAPKNGIASTTTTRHLRQPLPYAEQLALKGRVLLYEAPSHFWFRASSMGAAAFCTTYAVYQYWAMYLHPTEGLAWWIPHAFGVICMFMASAGGYFLLGTTRIVRSIEAVSVADAAKKLPAALGGAPAGVRGPIYIEISTQRMVPFMPRKRIVLWPEQVQLPFRMYNAITARRVPATAGKAGSSSLKAQVRAARAERDAKEKTRQYHLDHIMTAPFRDGKKVMGTIWAGMRRAFHRGGFAKIKLNRTNYKIDVDGGWALDEGRAIDRLFFRSNTSKA